MGTTSKYPPVSAMRVITHVRNVYHPLLHVPPVMHPHIGHWWLARAYVTATIMTMAGIKCVCNVLLIALDVLDPMLASASNVGVPPICSMGNAGLLALYSITKSMPHGHAHHAPTIASSAMMPLCAWDARVGST